MSKANVSQSEPTAPDGWGAGREAEVLARCEAFKQKADRILSDPPGNFEDHKGTFADLIQIAVAMPDALAEIARLRRELDRAAGAAEGTGG